MSIFDIFTPKAEAPAPVAANPQTPTTPGNIPEVPAVVADPNNPTAPVAAVDPIEEKPNSGLAQYEKLWDTPPTDPNAPSNEPQALDAAKLQELVSKASFTPAFAPETLAAIAAGGDEATTAFTEALNKTAQNVMVQSTLASNKLLEQKMEALQVSQAASIAEAIRKQATSASLVEVNPVFSNPAVKPVIEAVQAQLAAQNPNATPAELATMAQSFVVTMSESLNPKAPDASAEVVGQDWNTFLPPS